jgi:hypothetical protein
MFARARTPQSSPRFRSPTSSAIRAWLEPTRKARSRGSEPYGASDLLDPAIAPVLARAIVAFQSVVDAVRSTLEIQGAVGGWNNGVNVAARLEGVAAPGRICPSEDAWRQVKGRIDLPAARMGVGVQLIDAGGHL